MHFNKTHFDRKFSQITDISAKYQTPKYFSEKWQGVSLQKNKAPVTS